MTEETNRKGFLIRALENERFVNQANYILSIVTTFLGFAIGSSWTAGQLNPILLPLALLFAMCFMLKLFELVVKAQVKVIEARIDSATIDDSLKSDLTQSIKGFKYMGNLISNLVVSTQLLEGSVKELLGKLFKEIDEYERTTETTGSPTVAKEHTATVDNGKPIRESLQSGYRRPGF